ncbi:MAG: CPBP family intramembrane metalloprotease [bacterium]|nr:CPBP family intramembrane metalloprotease [bacterium]
MEMPPELPTAIEPETEPVRERWYPFRGKPFPTYGEAVAMTAGMGCLQVGIGIVIGVCLAVFYLLRGREGFELDAPAMVIIGVVSQLAIVPIIGWGVWRKRHPIGEALCAYWAPAGALLGTVVLSMGLNICLSELDNLVRATWPLLNFIEEFLAATPEAPVGMFIVICVMAPLLEEALFRGLILDGLLKRSTPRKAIIVSALLFSIAHLNPAQIPFAFLMGIILGWLFFRTRSLWTVVLAHFTLNSMAIVLPLVLTTEIPGYNAGPEAGVFHPLWLDLLGLGLFVTGMLIFAAATPSRAEAFAEREPDEETGRAIS